MVDPSLSVSYLGEDKFVQETFIGYKYGSYSKLGLVCERTDPSAYEEVKQDSDEDSMQVDETS